VQRHLLHRLAFIAVAHHVGSALTRLLPSRHPTERRRDVTGPPAQLAVAPASR